MKETYNDYDNSVMMQTSGHMHVIIPPPNRIGTSRRHSYSMMTRHLRTCWPAKFSDMSAYSQPFEELPDDPALIPDFANT